MRVFAEELKEKTAFMSSVSVLTLSSRALQVLLPAAQGNCNHNNRYPLTTGIHGGKRSGEHL